MFRFYLGDWQVGIGKLFTFGGLGVWTLVDVVLVAVRYIGPVDGSMYVQRSRWTDSFISGGPV